MARILTTYEQLQENTKKRAEEKARLQIIINEYEDIELHRIRKYNSTKEYQAACRDWERALAVEQEWLKESNRQLIKELKLTGIL